MSSRNGRKMVEAPVTVCSNLRIAMDHVFVNVNMDLVDSVRGFKLIMVLDA